MKGEDAGAAYQVELKARQDLVKALDRLENSLLFRLFYDLKREDRLSLSNTIAYTGSNVTPAVKGKRLAEVAKDKIPFLFRFGFNAAIRKYNRIHQAEGTFTSTISPADKPKQRVFPDKAALERQSPVLDKHESVLTGAFDQIRSSSLLRLVSKDKAQSILKKLYGEAYGTKEYKGETVFSINLMTTKQKEVYLRNLNKELPNSLRGILDKALEQYVSLHRSDNTYDKGLPLSQRDRLTSKPLSDVTAKMKPSVLGMRQDKTRDARVDRIVDRLFDDETDLSSEPRAEIPKSTLSSKAPAAMSVSEENDDDNNRPLPPVPPAHAGGEKENANPRVTSLLERFKSKSDGSNSMPEDKKDEDNASKGKGLGGSRE